MNRQLTKSGGFAAHAPMYRECGLPVFPFSARAGQPIWPEVWMPPSAFVEDTLFKVWCSVFPDENISLALGSASGICIIDTLTTDPDMVATIQSIVPPSPWRRTGGHGVAGAYNWVEGFAPFVIRHPQTYQIIVRGFGGEGQYTALPPSIRYDDAPSYEANCFLGGVLHRLPNPPEGCYERLCAALGILEDENRGVGDPHIRTPPWMGPVWRLKHQFAKMQRDLSNWRSLTN